MGFKAPKHNFTVHIGSGMCCFVSRDERVGPDASVAEGDCVDVWPQNDIQSNFDEEHGV